MIEPTFRTHLVANTPSALGGIFMNRAPTNPTYPYIVQRLIAKTNAGLGVMRARFQLDIFAQDPNGYGVAKGVATELTAAIRSFGGVDYPASYRAMEMESYDADKNVYQLIIDAVIYHDETKIFS